jgi:hypothetical protein
MSITTPAGAQAALDAMPIVEQGDMILASNFNTMRQAILDLAALVGVSTTDRTALVALAPAFFPISAEGAGAQWNLGLGFATNPVNGGDGWLPVELPNNSIIDSMIVTGQLTGPVQDARVFLTRIEIADPGANPTGLILVPLAGSPPNFSQKGLVTVPGAGPQGLLEYATVDTSKYRYIVEAKVAGNAPAGNLTIASIEVRSNRW